MNIDTHNRYSELRVSKNVLQDAIDIVEPAGDTRLGPWKGIAVLLEDHGGRDCLHHDIDLFDTDLEAVRLLIATYLKGRLEAVEKEMEDL